MFVRNLLKRAIEVEEYDYNGILHKITQEVSWWTIYSITETTLLIIRKCTPEKAAIKIRW